MLLNPAYRPLIKHLLIKPMTLTQLSQDLQSDMDSVYYKVKKLESIGLAHVAYKVARKGKPIKYYSMTSKSYEVPFNNTNNDTLEDLIVSQIMNRQEVFAKSLVNNINNSAKHSSETPGFIIELIDGVLCTYLKNSPNLDEDSSIIYWHPIFIRPSDVKEYYAELLELTQRYTRRGNAAERVEHILGIQLALKNT